jgi:MerR family transcriptional regulator, thiopeptide resistance regulator
MDQRTWSVGELARMTGLTVRTLHHYDELGLLAPAERTGAGHRRYGDADVRRLYRILALRRLGLPLADVGRQLGPDAPALAETVRLQLARVDEELAHGRALRERLRRLLAALEAPGEPSTEDLIEVMTMQERYYTPAQRETLARRADELGEAGLRRAEADWAEVIAGMRAEMQRGTEPADPRVQALLARWTELIEQFTGGDPGIRDSLQRAYEAEGSERASRGMVDAELMAYVARARDATG